MGWLTFQYEIESNLGGRLVNLNSNKTFDQNQKFRDFLQRGPHRVRGQ